MRLKPKADVLLEDHQDEEPGDYEGDECETITLTYRDNDSHTVEEIEFDVSVEEGVRFHWWMVSQGMSNA